MTLYEKALGTMLGSRFKARADDLNRPLTDDEVRAEAKYQLGDLPFKSVFEGKDLAKAKREMRTLASPRQGRGGTK